MSFIVDSVQEQGHFIPESFYVKTDCCIEDSYIIAINLGKLRAT